MSGTLNKADMVLRFRETFYRVAPFIGAIVFSTIVAYGLIQGSYSMLLLFVIIFLTLGAVTLALQYEIILLLCMACVLLADSYYVPDGINFYYTRFLPLGMLAVRSLMAMAIHRVKTEMLPGIMLRPFGIIFVLALLSTLYDKINPRMSLLRALSMGLMLAGLGVGIPTCMGDDRRLRRGLYVLLLLLVGFIVPGFLTSPFNPRATLRLAEYARIGGFFTNPNTLGVMAMLTLFPLIWWYYEASRRTRGFLALLIVLVLLSLFFSGSRASLIGALVEAVTFVIFIRINYRTKAMLIFLCAAVLVIYAAVPELKPAIMRQDYGWRPELWKRAFELGLQSPWYGIGFGSTEQLFEIDKPYMVSMGVPSAGSHSEYIRLFVALGAPAVGIILFGFITILVKAAVVVHRMENNMLPLCLMCAVIGGLVNAVFEDWIFSFGGAPTIPFWCFLTILVVIIKKNERPKQSSIEEGTEP
jgi:O-antigen ligase